MSVWRRCERGSAVVPPVVAAADRLAARLLPLLGVADDARLLRERRLDRLQRHHQNLNTAGSSLSRKITNVLPCHKGLVIFKLIEQKTNALFVAKLLEQPHTTYVIACL